MNTKWSRRGWTAAGAAALILAATTVASAVDFEPGKAYTGCLNRRTGTITAVAVGSSPLRPCSRASDVIHWNERGEPGPSGDQGAAGAAGAQGEPGPRGASGGFGELYWAATFHFVTDGCPADHYQLAIKRQWGPGAVTFTSHGCKLVTAAAPVPGNQGRIDFPPADAADLYFEDVSLVSPDNTCSVQGEYGQVICPGPGSARRIAPALGFNPEFGPVAVYRLPPTSVPST